MTGISPLASRSVTKDLQFPERTLKNLGIMRLLTVGMRAIRAFVTNVDTLPLFWLPAVLDERVMGPVGCRLPSVDRAHEDAGALLLHQPGGHLPHFLRGDGLQAA